MKTWDELKKKQEFDNKYGGLTKQQRYRLKKQIEKLEYEEMKRQEDEELWRMNIGD